MSTRTPAEETQDKPQTREVLRTVRLLVATYLAISVITLGVIIIERNDSSVVNAAVWIRASIVVATAILMNLFAAKAAGGSANGYLRLRLVSAIMVVAIVVIIALPGTFPMWLKIEQGVCGLILLFVVLIANGKRVRSAFSSK